MISNYKSVRVLAGIVSLCILVSCGEKSYNKINLMPAPTAHAEGVLDPLDSHHAAEIATHTNLFYATDRRISDDQDKSPHYANARGVALRVGTVEVKVDPPINNWEDLRSITANGQIDNYSLSVTETHEIGPLPFSAFDQDGNILSEQTTKLAADKFKTAINKQLALSGNRDVFIYVHGYNVDFEYPTLVSRELQHYLGYQGAFISYNWPATPKRLAYFKDLETADATRRNLRELITFLSTETQARRIHLIGYSAGSRLAFEVSYQIALQNQQRTQPNARLGQVILVGSDLDRLYFLQALEDGLLDGMDQLSIYMSSSDAALRVSRFLFGENRLGQISGDEIEDSPIERKLAATPKLALIDASEAPGADLGNGHWYFRSSPWASSDIFLTLLRGSRPENRGLVRTSGDAVWRFPDDYPEQLKQLNEQ